jgi:DNA-binding PadR family transcriptional regulator
LEREIFEPNFSLIDTLILFSLGQESQYGYKIEAHVVNLAIGRVMPGRSTIYKALKRLIKEGFVVAAGKEGRRQYYEITQAGEHQLKRDISLLRRLLRAYELRL